jgi:hypothetical protein
MNLFGRIFVTWLILIGAAFMVAVFAVGDWRLLKGMLGLAGLAAVIEWERGR